MFHRTWLLAFALPLALLCGLPAARADVIDWADVAGNDLWSVAANWTGTHTPPWATDIARFTNTGTAAAAGTVTSIADAPFGGVIGGIEFTNTTGSFHTASLGGGALQVNGDLVVNRELLTTVVAAFTAGSLSVGTPASRANIRVGYVAATNPASNVTGTLNLSGLTQFDAALADFSIGVRLTSAANNGNGVGTVTLAPLNNLDVTSLLLSASDYWGAPTLTSTLTFGATNNIQADTFTVAGRRGNATATLPAGGTLTLTGSSGPAADLLIGYNNVNTGGIAVGTLNTSAGAFNATLDDLVIGYHTSKTGGSGTGTLTLGANTNVTANSVVLGDAGTHPVDGAGTGVGTLNMAGGTFNVAGDVTLGTGTSTSAGTIAMTGGTMNIAGSLLDGAGTGRLVLLNGTVNVAGNLSLDVASSSPIYVGAVTSTSATAGVGVLDVNGTSAQIGLSSRRAELNIGRRTVTLGVLARGTLDLADVNTFTGYFTNLNIGTITATGTPESQAYGTFLLASDYNFIDATTITIADSANAGMTGLPSRMTLGAVNDFVVTNLNIGGRKAYGILDFAAPGSVLNLSGPGGARTNITVTNQSTSTGGGGATGTMNLAGSTFNALIGTWIVGSKVNGAVGNPITATVTMSSGDVDATSIILARRFDAGTGGTIRGTFNLQGGDLVVGSISGSPTYANTATDTVAFNFSGGTLTAGSITKGAATISPRN